MKTTLALQNAERFSSRLKRLHEARRKAKAPHPLRRRPLNSDERKAILKMTGGRCHICGGKFKKDEDWQADHVLAHTYINAQPEINGYLPAHALCNNYRWFYSPEEFQWILKLGVWIRTLIEKRNGLAMSLAERFVRYEKNRISRQGRGAAKTKE